MPDKLTDTEIIKALECCIKSSHFGECFENECPLASEKGCKVGKETLYPYALDLINRLQAENENYSKNNQTMTSDILKLFKELERAKAQINRLKKYDEERDIRLHARLTAEAKAKAYKEFAERLKIEYVDFDEIHEMILPENINKTIDDLLKELVGE